MRPDASTKLCKTCRQEPVAWDELCRDCAIQDGLERIERYYVEKRGIPSEWVEDAKLLELMPPPHLDECECALCSGAMPEEVAAKLDLSWRRRP